MKRGTIRAILALLATVALTRCSTASAEVPHDVLNGCRQAVSRWLIQPDSARWWEETGRRGDEGWRVSGFVDGVRHRTYTCHVGPDGEITAHVS